MEVAGEARIANKVLEADSNKIVMVAISNLRMGSALHQWRWRPKCTITTIAQKTKDHKLIGSKIVMHRDIRVLLQKVQVATLAPLKQWKTAKSLICSTKSEKPRSKPSSKLASPAEWHTRWITWETPAFSTQSCNALAILCHYISSAWARSMWSSANDQVNRAISADMWNLWPTSPRTNGRTRHPSCDRCQQYGVATG